MRKKPRATQPLRPGEALPPFHRRAWSEVASEWLLSDRFSVRWGDSWAALQNSEAQLSRLEAAMAILEPDDKAALADFIAHPDGAMVATSGALERAVAALSRRLHAQKEDTE
jgi:hypothetical protein